MNATREYLLNYHERVTLPVRHTNIRQQTASGYGKNLRTGTEVYYEKKWRRVYCAIYSNIGTCHIVVNRQKVVID